MFSGWFRHCFNTFTMTSEGPQQASINLVPDFNGLIVRATGKQKSGVKCDRFNQIIMTSESPQQISIVLVPNFDGLIKRTTGNQISGVKCD